MSTPGAVCHLQDILAEGRRAAVEHMSHAQRSEMVPLARTRRGEDLRARRLRQLDGRKAYPACPGVDEHAIARLQPRELERQRG